MTSQDVENALNQRPGMANRLKIDVPVRGVTSNFSFPIRPQPIRYKPWAASYRLDPILSLEVSFNIMLLKM